MIRSVGRLGLGITLTSTFFLQLSLPMASGAVGNLTWNSLSSGSYYFTDVATSDDGAKIIGITTANNERVMYSADGGSTFTNITPARSTGSAASFSSIAISGDGSSAYLALESGGPSTGSKIFKTTNFSTWTQLSGFDTDVYRTVTTNSDGSKVLIGSPSRVRVSINGGATWPTSSAFAVFGCDMNNSGSKMICFGDANTFKFSSDNGATWVSRAPAGTRFIFEEAATISGDGSVMYAVWSDWGGGYEGMSKVYKSTNDGVTWTEITSNLPEAAATANSGYRHYAVIDTNNTGSVILIGSRGYSTFGSGYQSGYIYLSDDSGASWSRQTGPGSNHWAAVALNASGSKMFAAAGRDLTILGTIWGSGLNLITSSSFNGLSFNGGATSLIFRVPTEISANVSAAGRVTFYADGKRIPGCINRTTSGSAPNIIATCPFAPSKRGSIKVYAVLDPTDPMITNSTSSTALVQVSSRLTKR